MTDSPDLTPELLEALAWQLELGADEAIGDAPVDRFAESAAAKTATAKTAATGTTPATRRAPGGAAFAAVHAPPRPEAAEPAEGGSARALARAATTLEELGRGDARLRGIAAEEGGAQVRLLRRAGGCPGDGDRRGAGRRGGPDRQALRRPRRAASRPDAGGDRAVAHRAGAFGCRLHNQHPALAAAGQPHPDAGRGRPVPALHRAPHRAGEAGFHPVCSGNTPTKTLLDVATGIKRMRGRWVRHAATGVALLPSFHPAYLLRQPADKRLAWRDLLSLRAALDGEGPELE